MEFCVRGFEVQSFGFRSRRFGAAVFEGGRVKT